MTDRIKITFQDRHTSQVSTIQARSGSNLWYLLRKHGIPIGSSCSGVGVCSSCAVHVHAQQADAVSAETPLRRSQKNVTKWIQQRGSPVSCGSGKTSP